MRFIISLLSTFILSFHLLAINHLRLPDIRALGTGINGVTQSIVHNPALVTLSINKEIQVEYFNRYGLKELSTMGFQFICPNSLLPFSISVSSFGYEEYRKSFFRLGMGKSLNERWKIGISFQCDLLQTELFEEVPKCISTDVGIVSEVLGEKGKKYILEERTKECLKNKIKEIIAQKQDFKEISEENLIQVKNNDWSNICLKYKEFFEKNLK